MTESYKAWQADPTGSDLPDIREVFRDDRIHEIAGIGIDPMLSGQALLTAACARCHNDRLSQTLTRARFNVDLARFSDLNGGVLAALERDATLEQAIQRLRMPAADTKHMPPERLRSLTDAQIEDLASFLCSQMTIRPGSGVCGTATEVAK